MSAAEEHIRSGNLEGALTALQDQVRKQPADPKLRTFLFQLLSVLGRWDRAMTQLNVVGEMDPSALPMVQTYREAIRCELLRAEVFAGRHTPLLFGKPAEWMALLVEALRLDAENKPAEAQALRDRAFEAAPATAGRADDQPFAWFADADPRLGPMLEAIVNGKYYWIPMERLSEITVEKPTDLRDFVWTAANLTLANGGQSVALIPTRYAGTDKVSDPRLLMGRSTEWVERPGGLHAGLGQRLFASDIGEHPLMDVRVIQLEGTDTAADAGTGVTADSDEGDAGTSDDQDHAGGNGAAPSA